MCGWRWRAARRGTRHRADRRHRVVLLRAQRRRQVVAQRRLGLHHGRLWQRLFLGQQALEAVIRAYDGRGAATALTAPVLQALGLDDELGLMHSIYYPTLNFGGIAQLARIVVRVAEQDAVAYAIVERGCAN